MVFLLFHLDFNTCAWTRKLRKYHVVWIVHFPLYKPRDDTWGNSSFTWKVSRGLYWEQHVQAKELHCSFQGLIVFRASRVLMTAHQLSGMKKDRFSQGHLLYQKFRVLSLNIVTWITATFDTRAKLSWHTIKYNVARLNCQRVHPVCC